MNDVLVIDASISLSWVLKESNESVAIRKLFHDIVTLKVKSIAPTIWLYEVVNGLNTGVLRKRMTKKQAEKKIPDLLQIQPELFDFTHFVNESFKIATEAQISIYDASYIALAKMAHCEFYTLDESLFNKVGERLSFVKLIS